MAEDVKLSISETNVLDICCKTEEACADLYHYFSKLYEDNPKASTIWKKTAVEEENHANQFRLASRLRGQGMKSLSTDSYKAKTLLAKLQSVYESVQKSPPPLKEAFRFAINLENSLSDYHMDTIATYEDESLANLFKAMMENDREHIQMLENAFTELCE